MSAMSNIYTTAMVISDLEDRLNELEELCVAVNEWNDDFPCDCNVCNDRDAVLEELRQVGKEWATFPVAIRTEAWRLIQVSKVVDA